MLGLDLLLYFAIGLLTDALFGGAMLVAIVTAAISWYGFVAYRRSQPRSGVRLPAPASRS
jgi:hypothetical protein